MRITEAEFMRGIRGTDELLSDGTPQIAFIGRSNVGKSSILNKLTEKKQLARVGKKPGKTTEINIYKINRAYYFMDLPGYGYAEAGPQEREKLRKLIVWYFTSDEAHPVKTVLILEAKAGLTRFDEEMIKVLVEKERPYMIVLNKVDKLSQKELAAQLATIKEKTNGAVILQTSTETGKGIDALRAQIFE
ncbi:MAG: ribosome biogenesis GTP-binding protein YsxC [Candidatus Pacebacteria bacterium]|nr:ribosome biogenesis GTP-binding protein YsxC [Candidatus Paceibacterota bacterium]